MIDRSNERRHRSVMSRMKQYQTGPVVIKSYAQCYIPNFNNLVKMDQFLENYRLPKFSQDALHNLNSSIATKYIKILTLSLPKRKFPGSLGFTEELCQTLKE